MRKLNITLIDEKKIDMISGVQLPVRCRFI